MGISQSIIIGLTGVAILGIGFSGIHLVRFDSLGLQNWFNGEESIKDLWNKFKDDLEKTGDDVINEYFGKENKHSEYKKLGLSIYLLTRDGERLVSEYDLLKGKGTSGVFLFKDVEDEMAGKNKKKYNVGIGNHKMKEFGYSEFDLHSGLNWLSRVCPVSINFSAGKAGTSIQLELSPGKIGSLDKDLIWSESRGREESGYGFSQFKKASLLVYLFANRDELCGENVQGARRILELNEYGQWSKREGPKIRTTIRVPNKSPVSPKLEESVIKLVV